MLGNSTCGLGKAFKFTRCIKAVLLVSITRPVQFMGADWKMCIECLFDMVYLFNCLENVLSRVRLLNFFCVDWFCSVTCVLTDVQLISMI